MNLVNTILGPGQTLAGMIQPPDALGVTIGAAPRQPPGMDTLQIRDALEALGLRATVISIQHDFVRFEFQFEGLMVEIRGRSVRMALLAARGVALSLTCPEFLPFQKSS